YPLSRRDSLGRGEYGYVHHAATAMVNAHTGRLTLIRDDSLDPIALTWVRRYPSLFVARAALAPDLLAALPPETDLARLQARVIARYGRRGETPPGGDLPGTTIDSLPAAIRDGDFALPGGAGVASAMPVVDANQHVTGLVIAAGGAPRGVYWDPLPRPSVRWSTISARLKAALDSAPALAPPGASRRGGVRVIPAGDGILYVQSEFAVRPDDAPQLVRSVVLAGDAVVTARSVAQALGAHGAGEGTLSAEEFRARTQALYAQMRQALQRGDWSAFGRAFEALGALAGRRAAP
ncbi:MAG TPA: UPF0182 family protein, partial [Gemmatimonadaceae bacterium]|nr:UPF0182 family protein [Gemmatimonadaceae bacterium]